MTKSNLTLILVLCSLMSFTQNNDTKVKIKPKQNSYSNVSFDKVLELEIPKSKNEKLINVEISKYKPNGKPSKFSYIEKKRIQSVYSYGKKEVKIDSNLITSIVSSDTAKKNIVDNGDIINLKMFPLNPQSNYQIELVWLTDISKNIQTCFFKEQITSSNTKKSQSTNAERVKKWLEIRSLLDKKKLSAAIDSLLKFDIQFSDGKLNKESKEVSASRKAFDSHDIKSSIKLFFSHYNEATPILFSCDSCVKDKLLLDRFSLNKENDFLLYIIDEDISKQIEEGTLPINFKSVKAKISKSNFIGRRKNLVETLNYIEHFLSVSQILGYECKTSNDIITKIKQKITLIDSYISKSKDLATTINYYKNKGTYIFNDFRPEKFEAQTGGYTTLETKGKFTVRPDLGLAFCSNLSNDPFKTFVPFWGFRFNLRPLDPNVPYSQIRYKSIWHRSSFNISFSYTSISDGETRFDIINNTNVLLGYGFRLNNAVNISAGTLLFNKKNSDPFVSSNQLAAMPYVGLSVDFEILDTFKKITDALFK